MAPATGDNDGVAYHNVVFIDTSLDTHLAMIVTDSETVSDFKEKILLEHRQLFPAIGDIKVECLKVKRRGSFYHLSDSMLVKNAFDVTKRNWFVSVDASRLEQNVGIQHSGKPKYGDQLALPWVTHSHSTGRQDYHGSPSVHSKTILFVNQKVTNTDRLTSGDSCKDASKNVEEDRSNNVKQLDQELQEKLYTVDTGINSKKRIRDVHNEGSLKDSFGSGPSAKKKRKTQRVKSNVKTSKEDIALAYDNEKVNDKNTSINNEDSFEHKLKGKDLSDENNRTNKVENCSVLDQVAVVPSIEGVGSETVGDVAMVVENNVQQDMSIGLSQKEKYSEPVQKPAVENEIHSSLTRTPDCEGDATGVTASSHVKRLANHKAAEKEVASTQQDVGSHGQDCEGIQIDKHKDALEISLKQRPEISTIGKNTSQVNAQGISDNLEKQNEKMDDTTKKKKKRKSKKSAGRNEDESIKHADGDISSMVLASVTDERKSDEVSEKTLIDAKKGDDVIGKEVDISVDNMEEISRKEFTDTNDDVTLTNEEHVLPHSETMMNNDAEISTLGKDTNQVYAQVVSDNLKKQNEKKDDKTKKKRKIKTKSKKPAGRNEDESITKHVDGDIFENIKEGNSSLPVADRKDGDKVKEIDAQNCHEGVVGEANKNNKSQDLPSEQQFTEVELESKKSQSVDHHCLPENTLKNVTGSEASNANNKADISENGSHELDFRDYFAPGHQPKKIASINNRKENKRKDNSRNAQSQKLVSKDINDKVSIDVLKDPNITNLDKVKTPKKTKKINAQNTTKQQSLSVQTHVKTMKNKSVTRSQRVKSLFNTPGTIFGDDSDNDATANTDSSTRTPSEKLSSSSSSTESYSSRYSRRNMSHAREGQEGVGKNNTNSHFCSTIDRSVSKKTSMSDLLRRSSGFKKAKVTASSQVDDTESQPVDFVPDSQPMGN